MIGWFFTSAITDRKLGIVLSVRFFFQLLHLKDFYLNLLYTFHQDSNSEPIHLAFPLNKPTVHLSVEEK